MYVYVCVSMYVCMYVCRVGSAAQRRAALDRLLARADQFTRVYDVKQLQVQYTAIVDGRRVTRALERPFFYEPYVCLCACVCEREYVCVCVCLCLRVRVYAWEALHRRYTPTPFLFLCL
jgi:hypothetical protein